jgi:hypothetical protein
MQISTTASQSLFNNLALYCFFEGGEGAVGVVDGRRYMAAADSSVLLDELLTQASDPLALPRLTDDEGLAEGGDGIGTWTRLMHNIGRSEEVREQAESRNWVFDDSMLREWVRQKLTERELQAEGGMRGSDEAEFPSFLDVRLGEGTLLRAGDCPGFILDRQFLYKSLLVVLNVSDKFTLGAVLNRPTATVAQLALEGASETINRRVCFGGDIVVPFSPSPTTCGCACWYLHDMAMKCKHQQFLPFEDIKFHFVCLCVVLRNENWGQFMQRDGVGAGSVTT